VKRRLLIAAVIVAVAAVVVVGLVQTGGHSGSGPGALSAQQIRSGVAGAPATLAGVHAQGDQLLGGGQKALDARLASLRGYPVVVNVWGSWCDPCRAEFPLFQRASVTFSKQVAFLGIDTQDPKDSAAKFLKSVPVPYPSFLDFQQAIAHHYGLVGTPSTIFYDAKGKLVTVNQGQYHSQAELVADVKKYALGA
jgi:cytochrome c biogenesis protein CcmG/thiol:disulfide interchange protein DsbE